MEDGMVNTTLLAVISWSTYFMLTKKFLPNYSYEFRNRIVSTTHAILAVTLASHSVKDWSCPVCPNNSNSNPQQIQALAVTMGYLIYDLVCSQFDKKSNLDNTIHHLVSIIGIVAGISYQKCVSEMIAALFITEISSPFLHLREFLKELGYRDTDLNLAAYDEASKETGERLQSTGSKQDLTLYGYAVMFLDYNCSVTPLVKVEDSRTLDVAYDMDLSFLAGPANRDMFGFSLIC